MHAEDRPYIGQDRHLNCQRVSKVHEKYITQRGSVGTWMGLGFNICVAPTLMFCPCILEGGTNWGSEGAGENKN